MGLDVQIDKGDAKTRIEPARILPNYLLKKGSKIDQKWYPEHKLLIKCCDK